MTLLDDNADVIVTSDHGFAPQWYPSMLPTSSTRRA